MVEQLKDLDIFQISRTIKQTMMADLEVIMPEFTENELQLNKLTRQEIYQHKWQNKPPTGVLSFAKIICLIQNEKVTKPPKISQVVKIDYWDQYKKMKMNAVEILTNIDKESLGGLVEDKQTMVKIKDLLNS